ncbi:hypothetical protein AAFF_G00107980 [Aldrovandia affinis]|uniref:Uncharacterized protein n=1 Tax=Aldrovandia affinis TaxID=143900 RepID=A0AAD7WC14_9TELE|nr:hypothetical protein AAFF_G00107980 [Aldrovandia affinis]
MQCNIIPAILVWRANSSFVTTRNLPQVPFEKETVAPPCWLPGDSYGKQKWPRTKNLSPGVRKSERKQSRGWGAAHSSSHCRRFKGSITETPLTGARPHGILLIIPGEVQSRSSYLLSAWGGGTKDQEDMLVHENDSCESDSKTDPTGSSASSPPGSRVQNAP